MESGILIPIILIICVLLAIPLYAFIFIIIPAFFGAPYEGSSEKVIKKTIAFSKIRKNEKVADLGSGDGRVVIAFAKKGAEAHGFEINPFLVFISRRKIKKEKLGNKAFIHWKSFWKEDLGKFSVINTFQVYYVMPKLEKKLQKELRAGSKVISNTWKFPSWKLAKKEDNIYVYKKI